MAKELAPRLLLTQIIRTILIFFGVAALMNAHAYIGTRFTRHHDHHDQVTAAFAASWTAVGWNALAVAAAAVHPYLQRLADGLPFPVSVTVRGRPIISYGESGDGTGDGVMAPLAGKLVFALVDATLATLLVVLQALARGLWVECGSAFECLAAGEGSDGKVYIPAWTVNVWLTLAVFEYVVAVVQGFEAVGIWYHSRYLKKRGQISLA